MRSRLDRIGSWSGWWSGVVAVVAAIVVIVAAPGCSGSTETGTGYTVKVNRELASYVEADIARTHAEALDMILNDYLYELKREAIDAREGIIEARSAKGRTIKVETYMKEEYLTKVDIFVGPFGDLRTQVDMLSSLERRLGKPFTPRPPQIEEFMPVEPSK